MATAGASSGSRLLASFGATGQEADELLASAGRTCDPAALAGGVRLPLPDEPFVATWEGWEGEARQRGAGGTLAVLRERLPQLHFPIQEGMSQREDYRAATLRGVPPAQLADATGLPLRRPEAVQLAIHPSAAGRIPVLTVRDRADFISLVRALARRNEPSPVADSMGALMVSGYVNWERVGLLKRQWEERDPEGRPNWPEEMKALSGRRELYQDRFVMLSDGPYSAVPAAQVGLDEAAWREASLLLRRDHECTHHLTRRLFGVSGNPVLEELLADYSGIVAAAGRFDAAWFLRFMGLEELPAYRAGGRLGIYRGNPPLSDGAFRALQQLVAAAARNLERFDRAFRAPASPRAAGPHDTARVAVSLLLVGLVELAAPGGDERLGEVVARMHELLPSG